MCGWNANLGSSGGICMCLRVRGVLCIYIKILKHTLEVAANEEEEEQEEKEKNKTIRITENVLAWWW